MSPYQQSLYEIAESQHGYVTATQARSAGIPASRLVQMVKEGSLERVSRGVYRLPRFPHTDLAQFMEAILWPAAKGQDVWGVVSHDSALVVHELSDVNPPKVHITVPRGTRIRRAVPRYLVVHRADVSPADVVVVDGIRVTSPERTVRDAAAAHMTTALIRQAIDDGRRRGRFTRIQADRLRRELADSLRRSSAPSGMKET